MATCSLSLSPHDTDPLDCLWKEHFLESCLQVQDTTDVHNGELKRNKKEKKRTRVCYIGHSGQGQTGSQKSDYLVSLVASLKACGMERNLYSGRDIHLNIVHHNLLENNMYLASAVVSMYAKCGALDKAQQTFDQLLVHNSILWNSLIAGYAYCGHGKEAIECFEHMKLQSIAPDAVTYVCTLKACGRIKALDKGREVHAEIVQLGSFENKLTVSNALVGMYAKCDAFTEAHRLLDELPNRDVVSFNTLMAAYTNHYDGDKVMYLFEQMHVEGYSANAITYACILKIISSFGSPRLGLELHDRIVKEGLLESQDTLVGNALVDMYAKCGALEEAVKVFDGLPVHDITSWTVLLGAYTEKGHGIKAIGCSEQMHDRGLAPDKMVFACILKACGSIGALDKGKQIHAIVAANKLLENSVVIGNAVVDMYAKCGALARAQEVFDGLSIRDAVSWNVLITGYAQHGQAIDAIQCFDWMQLGGFSPDETTFACVLKACGAINNMEKGQEMHADVVRAGLVTSNIVVGTALMDMYAKCGVLTKAVVVFDQLEPNAVSWNVLIAAYAQQERYLEAIACFEQMKLLLLSPDAVTFACILKAYGGIGAANRGHEIHGEIAKDGLVGTQNIVCNALVDMYAKCGVLGKAQDVFDEIQVRDEVSWNVVMAGYSQCGKMAMVLSVFNAMIEEGIEPNPIAMLILINTCSHLGLLDRGQIYFQIIISRYCITPTMKHFTCMVDIYFRAGYSSKAIALIKGMPYSSTLAIWHAALGACQYSGNVELGRLAFKHAIQLNEADPAAYVCMKNIYAGAGMARDVNKVSSMNFAPELWDL